MTLALKIESIIREMDEVAAKINDHPRFRGVAPLDAFFECEHTNPFHTQGRYAISLAHLLFPSDEEEK